MMRDDRPDRLGPGLPVDPAAERLLRRESRRAGVHRLAGTELIHDGSAVRLCMLQLPAVNTPQAVRQRNKLLQQAQPMPPLFSPESIAESVIWAIEHGPREMLIGVPTVQAVWGQVRPSTAGSVPRQQGLRATDGRRAERSARARHPVRSAARRPWSMVPTRRERRISDATTSPRDGNCRRNGARSLAAYGLTARRT